jgi:hypothetical protein
MTAYFEVHVTAGELARVLRVEGVGGAAHAKVLLAHIERSHADKARLLSLEDQPLHYTASEVETERNLFGRGRR